MGKKAILGGLFEVDAPDEKPAPPAREEHPMTPASVYSAGPVTSASYPPISGTIGSTTNVTLTAEDQEKIKALTAKVYSIPSNYMSFQRVRETLDNTNDLRQVLKVMGAVNPGITPQKILTDIDQHLSIIATQRNEFENTVAQTRESRIAGPTREIADLTRANEQAKQEIERINREVMDRSARMTQLQTTINDANRSIAEGEARFKLIEDQLKTPLVQAKQILSSL